MLNNIVMTGDLRITNLSDTLLSGNFTNVGAVGGP